MPQMGPLFWATLNTIVICTFLALAAVLFFAMFPKKPSQNASKNEISSNKLPWKW